MNPGNYMTVALIWIGIAFATEDNRRAFMLIGGAVIWTGIAVALRRAAKSI